MPLDDLTGKTADQLRAAAERYRAEAQQRVFDALWPIVNMALVVLALERLAASAGEQPPVFVDLSALKIKGLHSTAPVPIYTAPDVTRPALRQQQPRFDSDFDLYGVRWDSAAIWLLVYRDKPTGKLEYWVRLGDIKIG